MYGVHRYVLLHVFHEPVSRIPRSPAAAVRLRRRRCAGGVECAGTSGCHDGDRRTTFEQPVEIGAFEGFSCADLLRHMFSCFGRLS